MKELKAGHIAILIVLGFLALGIVGRGDYDDAVAQEDIYCEFVELWGQTNGRDGHPDFRGIYATTCGNEKRGD